MMIPNLRRYLLGYIRALASELEAVVVQIGQVGFEVQCDLVLDPRIESWAGIVNVGHVHWDDEE